MREKILEQYSFEVDSKKVKVTIMEVLEDDSKEPIYYAKSDFKNVFGVGKTLEEAKRNCESAVSLKNDIVKGKVKLMKTDEAEKLAKQYFMSYFKEKNISQDIAKNLCSSSTTEGKDYILEVEYLDKSAINEIKQALFETFPELMATIRVDRETGVVTLSEASGVKW